VREGERETERQREKQKGRERNRKAERETERQREKQKGRERNRKAEKRFVFVVGVPVFFQTNVCHAVVCLPSPVSDFGCSVDVGNYQPRGECATFGRCGESRWIVSAAGVAISKLSNSSDQIVRVTVISVACVGGVRPSP